METIKKNPQFLSAEEAAAVLGVKLDTLYSYVSRGLIHSEVLSAEKRERRYYKEDIEGLKRQKEYQRDPGKAVKSALSWGLPVLESKITLITDTNVFYRGYDAVKLATTSTVEKVAGLIWLGDLDAGELFDQIFLPSKEALRLCSAESPFSTVEKFQLMLTAAQGLDAQAHNTSRKSAAQTGARILSLLTTIAVGSKTKSAGIARTLQSAWLPETPDSAHLISMAIILCADYELTVSSFVARCVASTGSTPYSVVQAGLAALQGYKTGGETEKVFEILQRASDPDEVNEILKTTLKRGERIPGLGNRMHTDIDPRARALLTRLDGTYANSDGIDLVHTYMKIGEQLTGTKANVDFSLAATAFVLGLPSGSAMTIYSLSRTIRMDRACH